MTVQHVSRMVERVFDATSLNIAIQDGVDAGQSVPHVHAHIIPRKKADLEEMGGTDAIYEMLEGKEGDLNRQLKDKESTVTEERAKFPVVDDDARKPRSDDEMQTEAQWLVEEMAKDGPAEGHREQASI